MEKKTWKPKLPSMTELQIRIYELFSYGFTATDISKELGCSRAYVQRFRAVLREYYREMVDDYGDE